RAARRPTAPPPGFRRNRQRGPLRELSELIAWFRTPFAGWTQDAADTYTGAQVYSWPGERAMATAVSSDGASAGSLTPAQILANARTLAPAIAERSQEIEAL